MDESIVKHLEQTNEVADVLRRAREIISDERNWFGSKGTLGSNCALTALDRAAGVCLESAHPLYRALLAGMDGATGIAMYNNTHTHAEVMAAFDRAIELAQSGRT